MWRLTFAVGAVTTLLVLPPARAHAEPIAAYDRPGPGGDLDIALAVATTGEPITLPAGINTSADEFHPSLSGDGRLLTFERATPAGMAYAGADANVAKSDPLPPFDSASQPDKQIIVVDLHSGTRVQPTAFGIADRTKITGTSCALWGDSLLVRTAGASAGTSRSASASGAWLRAAT
jgi:hypothetical protein